MDGCVNNGIPVFILLTWDVQWTASTFDIAEGIQQTQGMSPITNIVLELRLNV